MCFSCFASHIFQLRLDEDGDLILNRSRIFVSPHHNTDNTDDASEYGEEEKDLRDCLSKHTEDEEKPRKYDLNVITLSRYSVFKSLPARGDLSCFVMLSCTSVC